MEQLKVNKVRRMIPAGDSEAIVLELEEILSSLSFLGCWAVTDCCSGAARFS